jgi:hypothetical protein
MPNPFDSTLQKHHGNIDFCYYRTSSSSERDMKIIQFIAHAFINTMGITQPSPEAANRAAWFIVIMLAAVLAAVATVAIVAVHYH